MKMNWLIPLNGLVYLVAQVNGLRGWYHQTVELNLWAHLKLLPNVCLVSHIENFKCLFETMRIKSMWVFSMGYGLKRHLWALGTNCDLVPKNIVLVNIIDIVLGLISCSDHGTKKKRSFWRPKVFKWIANYLC